MMNINEIKELMNLGWTKEEIIAMCQGNNTPEVANANAKETTPVDPMKQVLFTKEFDVKKVGKVLEPSTFIGKSLYAKALRKVNTLALKKGYKTIKGCKTGWEFEDEKEAFHALKNFKFIHNLTVEMYLEYLKTEEDEHLAQAEYFATELDNVRKQYGVK